MTNLDNRTECKLAIFAGAYIPQNVYLTIENPVLNLQMKLEQIGNMDGTEIKNILRDKATNAGIQQNDLEKATIAFKTHSENFPLIQITFEPYLILKNDFDNNRLISEVTSDLETLSFLLGSPIDNLAVTCVTKDGKRAIQLANLAPRAVNSVAHKNFWRLNNLEQLIREYYMPLLKIYREFDNFRNIIQLYNFSLELPHPGLRIIQYNICLYALKTIQHRADYYKDIINIVDDFLKTNRKELQKYKEIRDAFIHTAKFPQEVEFIIDNQKVRNKIDYDIDAKSFRILIFNLLLQIAKSIQVNKNGAAEI